METRTVNEVKIWKIVLNPMYERCECIGVAVMSTDRQKLVDFLESKKVEIYSDDGFNKNFERGSLLEMFNDINYSGEKIQCEWVDEEFFNGELQNDGRFLK